MYKVYYGETCIYNDLFPLKEYKLIDPTLTLEANNAGSLSFGLPITNVGYNEITAMVPDFRVMIGDETIFEGRAITEDADFNNTRNVVCEGALAYLNDTCQPQKEYHNVSIETFIEGILSEHNSKVDDKKKIYKGNITVTDPMANSYRYTQFEKSLESINTIIETYGGYMRIRYQNGRRYLDYFNDCPSTSSQNIEFGVNLLDLTKSFDSTEMATVILPLGKTLASAGSTSVGEQLSFGGYDNWPGHYVTVDQEETGGPYFVNVHDDASSAFKMCIYQDHGDLGGKTFFISCRNISGNIMYVWCGKDPITQRYIALGSVKKAGTGAGSTDMIQEKVTAPEHSERLVICGFGDDIPIALYDVADVTEKLDKYLTVEEVRRTYFDETEQVEKDSVLVYQNTYDQMPDNVKNDGRLYQTQDTHKLYQNGSDLGSTLYVRNEQAIAQYGWIEKQITWSDVEDKDELYALAENYLTEEQFNQYSLEISAVDLASLGVDVTRIKLLDYIWAFSSPHDIEHKFPVTKLEIKLNQPESSTYTLGDNVTPSLTSVNNEINEEIAKKIAMTPSLTDSVEAAKEAAGAVVASSTGGYVTLKKDATDSYVEEILISDTEDYLLSTNIWRWNINGLAHSSNGYYGTYSDAAITMDGRIIANSLAANSAIINSIVSGTLRVGISGSLSGAIAVYDSSNNRIGAVDEWGIESADYSSGTKRWMKMMNNQLIFGNQNDGAHSYVQADYDTILEGQARKTVEIDSECVIVDTTFFGITTNHGSGNLQIGQTGTVDVVTAVDFSNQSVTKKRLTFTKGILTGVDNI